MDYSYQDMVKMQEDAARRVQDMRRRAKMYVDEENAEPQRAVSSVPSEIPRVPDRARVISLPVDSLAENRKSAAADISLKNPPSKAEDSGLNSLINSDSALILSLCMLLQAEKADEGLIMALLYLLV